MKNSDPVTVGYTGLPTPMTANQPTVPGSNLIIPPRPAPLGRANNAGGPSGGRTTAWVAGDRFDPTRPAQEFGMINFRWSMNRTTAGFIDGHVEAKSTTEMRDMRMWSNSAGQKDWNYQGGPHITRNPGS